MIQTLRNSIKNYFTQNPYQTLNDWIHGRWTCPECGLCQKSIHAPSDCLLSRLNGTELIDKRVQCIRCNYEETVINGPGDV